MSHRRIFFVCSLIVKARDNEAHEIEPAPAAGTEAADAGGCCARGWR
jgi:hypothetical protein